MWYIKINSTVCHYKSIFHKQVRKTKTNLNIKIFTSCLKQIETIKFFKHTDETLLCNHWLTMQFKNWLYYKLIKIIKHYETVNLYKFNNNED